MMTLAITMANMDMLDNILDKRVKLDSCLDNHVMMGRILEQENKLDSYQNELDNCLTKLDNCLDKLDNFLINQNKYHM